MNTPPEERPVSHETPSDRRRKWRCWLVLLALAGAAGWFFFGRTESHQARTEREVRRILSAVRREDPSSFSLRSIPQKMQNWPAPFPKLAAMLLDDEESMDNARESLSALGPLAIPILTNLLVRDRSPAVRAAVADALGEMGDSRLLPLFVTAFAKESESRVQSSILEALGRMGDEQARPLLISVLQGTNDSDVRASAVHALENFQSPVALAALTNALLTEVDKTV